MTDVTITVTPIAIQRTNITPQEWSGDMTSGQVDEVQITGFKNTGNVEQTLTLNGIVDPIGCTVSNPYIYGYGDSAVLQPGEQAEVRATVSGVTLPLSDDPDNNTVEVSFKIDTTWS